MIVCCYEVLNIGAYYQELTCPRFPWCSSGVTLALSCFRGRSQSDCGRSSSLLEAGAGPAVVQCSGEGSVHLWRAELEDAAAEWVWTYTGSTSQTCQGHVTKTHYIRRVILLCVRRCSFYCINLYITNVVLNRHDAKSVCKKLEMMILNGSGF